MVVFDASTLILLARSGLLDIFLDDFRGEALVPAAVQAECAADPIRPDGILIRKRIEEGRLEVERVKAPRSVARLREDFRLGQGEAEAVALALEKGSTAVVATDDRNAIRACKVLRVGFVTALGILTRATEKGLLRTESAASVLSQLATLGRYRTELVEEVARRLGGIGHGESTEDGERSPRRG